jgi:hypothetical protein
VPAKLALPPDDLAMFGVRDAERAPARVIELEGLGDAEVCPVGRDERVEERFGVRVRDDLVGLGVDKEGGSGGALLSA